MWRTATLAAVVLGCPAMASRCAADMPAMDIYKVRWEPLKAAAATLGGERGSFVADVERGAARQAEGAEPGVLVFRTPFGFTEPLNQMLLANVAAGRREQAEAFLRAVNDGGWITGQLIARNGGDYVVSIACVGEPSKDFVVEYTHKFSGDHKAVHSHHVRAKAGGGSDGGLAWVTDAEGITIEDHWAGYGPASPAMADYALKREAGEFAGKADFSAGGHFRPKAKKDSCDVRVPAAAASDFLKALAECASRDGEYKPGIHHTDDYPNIRITVKAAAKTAIFRTESQGEFHAPWAIEQDGKTRVVEGDAPGRALKALRPHLARERFDALVKEVVSDNKAGGDL